MYSQKMFLKVLLSKKHAAWHHLYRPAHRSACAIWLSLWCSWAFFLVTIRLMSLVLENRKNRAWIKTIVYLYSSKHERCRWIRCCCNLQNDCGCLVDWQDNLLPHPPAPISFNLVFQKLSFACSTTRYRVLVISSQTWLVGKRSPCGNMLEVV